MKRSEMLSKIASAMINYNHDKWQIDRKLALEIAGTILYIQEEVGMIPPDNTKEKNDHNHNHTWKPEDET